MFESDKRQELKEHDKPEKKLVTITVNGSPHDVPKDDITYAQVVAFAFPDASQHPEINYSVTYTKGHNDKPEGILSPGGSVKAKEGMDFVVSDTGQS